MYTCITTCSAVDISNNVSELVQQPACSRTLVHVHAHTHVHARTDTYTHIHTYTYTGTHTHTYIKAKCVGVTHGSCRMGVQQSVDKKLVLKLNVCALILLFTVRASLSLPPNKPFHRFNSIRCCSFKYMLRYCEICKSD